MHNFVLNFKTFNMKSIITFLFFAVASNSFGQFWNPTGALVTAGGGYLVAAASIGDNVYAIGATTTFVHSTDKGVTWTAPAITPPPGACYALIACNNYLYASMKLNTYDHELHYSLDHGVTWNIDRKSTRLNSSHVRISYAVFCLKKKRQYTNPIA